MEVRRQHELQTFKPQHLVCIHQPADSIYENTNKKTWKPAVPCRTHQSGPHTCSHGTMGHVVGHIPQGHINQGQVSQVIVPASSLGHCPVGHSQMGHATIGHGPVTHVQQLSSQYRGGRSESMDGMLRQWNCSVCTYLNKACDSKCSVCEHSRLK